MTNTAYCATMIIKTKIVLYNTEKPRRNKMKTLMMSLMAAAFVLVAASMASANMMGSDYHGLTAIDSAGIASIAIHSPSAPVVKAESEKLVFDSNGLFAVNVLKATETSAVAGTDMEKGKNLYCFDSVTKFCAKAY